MLKNHEKTTGALIMWSLVFLACIGCCVAILAMFGEAYGDTPKQWDVTFAWDANTEPDLLEYRLYQNGELIDSIPAGTETTNGVVEAGDYEWYLTARDQSLNESGPSNTVSLSLDEVPPSMGGVTINVTIGVHVNP